MFSLLSFFQISSLQKGSGRRLSFILPDIATVMVLAPFSFIITPLVSANLTFIRFPSRSPIIRRAKSSSSLHSELIFNNLIQSSFLGTVYHVYTNFSRRPCFDQDRYSRNVEVCKPSKSTRVCLPPRHIICSAHSCCCSCIFSVNQ